MRKRLRLPKYDYSLGGAYFITVCTYERRPVLEGMAAALVASELFQLQVRFRLTLDYHVVMTDHVHAILFLPSSTVTLSQVVGAFKSLTTIQLHRLGLDAGKVWQRSFFDRVVRDEKELMALRQYIQQNPLADAVEKGVFGSS